MNPRKNYRDVPLDILIEEHNDLYHRLKELDVAPDGRSTRGTQDSKEKVRMYDDLLTVVRIQNEFISRALTEGFSVAVCIYEKCENFFPALSPRFCAVERLHGLILEVLLNVEKEPSEHQSLFEAMEREWIVRHKMPELNVQFYEDRGLTLLSSYLSEVRKKILFSIDKQLGKENISIDKETVQEFEDHISFLETIGKELLYLDFTAPEYVIMRDTFIKEVADVMDSVKRINDPTIVIEASNN